MSSHRFAPRALTRRAERGQALAEFALVLPVLILLLVMAIDFGRVFFGFVGLQNVARIAANYAALNATRDWTPAATNDNYQDYVAEIVADASAINCDLDADGDGDIDHDDIPAPTFPSGTAVGADAVASITCDFSLITPLAASIVGDVTLGAEATFPVRAGIAGGPSGGGGTTSPLLCREVPDLSNMYVADARDAWAFAGFAAGTFSPAAGDDDRLVASQLTTPPSTAGDCIDFRSTVSVSYIDPHPTCSGTDVIVPSLLGLSVADARVRWSAEGFDPANFSPPSGDDGQVVVTQAFGPPVINAGDCADPVTTFVTITFDAPQDPPPCQVPDFVGVPKNSAQGIWTAAGFTTTVLFSGQGNNNWTISSQDVEAHTFQPCTSTVITVFR